MRRTHLLPLTLLIVALPALAREPATQPAKTFCWKVTSPTNTVHLLGSIHVATADFYPLPAEVEKAFADANNLAVEVDITKVDQMKLVKTMTDKGMYEKNDTLADHVSKETFDAFRAYREKNKLPATYEKFRPWALAVVVSMGEIEKLGFKPEWGVDRHFLDQAKGKAVLELESAEQQLAVLSGFGAKEQEQFLAQTLAEAPKMKETITAMVDVWKAGDAKGMYEQVVERPIKEHPGVKAVMARLIDERNAAMAEKVGEYLKGKEPTFVVVGAAHLVGPNGMVAVLEKKGYKVEQVTTAKAPATAPVKSK